MSEQRERNIFEEGAPDISQGFPASVVTVEAAPDHFKDKEPLPIDPTGAALVGGTARLASDVIHDRLPKDAKVSIMGKDYNLHDPFYRSSGPTTSVSESVTQPTNKAAYTSTASGTKDPSMARYETAQKQMEAIRDLPPAERAKKAEAILRSVTPDVQVWLDSRYAADYGYKPIPQPVYSPETTKTITTSEGKPPSFLGKAAQIGTKGLGGAAMGLDAANAAQAFKEGNIGKGIFNAAGALGGGLQFLPHPAAKALGAGLSYAPLAYEYGPAVADYFKKKFNQ